MRATAKKMLLALLAVAAVFSIAFVGARISIAGNQETAETSEAAGPLEASQSIAIPGYDVISLSAGQTQQSVHLYNPDANKCFFTVSLSVDGAEVYTSPMLAPNAQIESIDLNEPLLAGNYEGVLVYSCYDLYTQRELNGAKMAVKLEVR
jgi:hypothetical protein